MRYYLSFLICFTFSLATGQTTWQIDPDHSFIQFEVTHMVVSTVTGDFTDFKGYIEVPSGNKSGDFKGSQIDVAIDVASINTRNKTRDEHLREDDFFNAEKYPKIKFKSKSFEKVGENSYTIIGDLTIRDVTKEVILNAEMEGQIIAEGKIRTGFKADGRLNRFDYGLKWNDALDSGSLVVGEKVDIKLNVVLVKETVP